jgi:hypothetical protein
MGLFGKATSLFARGLHDIASAAPVAQALVDGDYRTAGTLQLKEQERELAISKMRETYAAMRESGMSHQDAALALTNPEEFGKNFNSRFGAYSLDEGSTRVTPGLDGKDKTFTAPKFYQNGADVGFIDPQNRPPGGSLGGTPPPLGAGLPAGMGGFPPGMSQGPERPYQLGGNRQISIPDFDPGAAPGGGLPPLAPTTDLRSLNQSGGPASSRGSFTASMRTEAEQFADSLGLTRGTKEWGTAVRDYVLKEDGPTALEFDERRNIRDNETRRGNSIRSAQARAARGGGAARPPKGPTKTSIIGALLQKQARGEALSPSEQTVLTQYGGAKNNYPDGTIIEMPDGSTKEMKNGRWVNFGG